MPTKKCKQCRIEIYSFLNKNFTTIAKSSTGFVIEIIVFAQITMTQN